MPLLSVSGRMAPGVAGYSMDAPRLGLMRRASAQTQFKPSAVEMQRSFAFLAAHPNRCRAISQYPNHLQVTIDKLYQRAIIVSISWHDSFLAAVTLVIVDPDLVGVRRFRPRQ